MSKKQAKTKSYNFRAKLPIILRGVAFLGVIATIFVIGFGFYWNSGNEEFRLKPQHTQLSEDVVGIVNGYERRETDEGILKYYIKADKATTFSDNHQELENVFLQVFDEDNLEISDNISANKAIYIPAKDDSKNFIIYFAGEVDVKTKYALNIQTEQLSYDKSTEIADSQELVEFQRENVSGKSIGAVVNIRNKTLDLQKDVEIFSYASDNEKGLFNNDFRRVKLKSGRAFIEQITEKIKLENGVEISLTPSDKTDGELSQPTDIRANSATAYFSNQEIRKIDLNGNVNVYQKPTKNNIGWTKTKANRAIVTVNKELKNLELFENIQIETASDNSKPTKIKSSKAVYDKDLDKFELDNDVEILTVNQTKITKITANKAVYEQTLGRVLLTGNAKILQADDYVIGDVIKAELYVNKSIKYALAIGNAYLKQITPQKTNEVKASEINANFYQNQKIQKANAKGNSEVVVIPVNSSEYTRFNLLAPNAINLDFRNDGTLYNLQTQGRTTIKLKSPNNAPDSANKTLIADKINTTFRNNGNELAKAIAKGNVELLVEPLNSSPKNYRSIVRAPRLDCDFYPKNNAKNCSASGRANVVRFPTVKTKEKQTIIANKLNAIFDKNTQDVERLDAIGNAKFTEEDRQGIAGQIIYTAANEYVRFRGEEPTVWDSKARAKAKEIDWDTKNEKSILNGSVSTTYFSQNKTGGSTPFSKGKSPVFLTALTAQFDHSAKTGIYTGNARAWQDNNYIRAEKILIKEKQGEMFAEGKVQSMLYNVNQTVGQKKSKTQVYAASNKMLYQRNIRLIRYEQNVDIRQGADRIVGEIANVYLDKNNELTKTIIEKNVVLTQPNRRASGNFAQYNANDESVILRGNPARVRDIDSGSTTGKEIFVNLKNNNVVNKGRTSKNSTGRVRTVYKIKDGKIN